MNYKELTDKEVSNFIMNDPSLIYMGFSDEELNYMYENKFYPVDPNSFYIGIEESGVLVGVLKWEYFTESCISIHLYLSSKYQGKGFCKATSKFVAEHLAINTNIKKMIVYITDVCKHVIYAAEACGFKQEGHITNCIPWRGEVVGVLIYGLDLEERN